MIYGYNNVAEPHLRRGWLQRWNRIHHCVGWFKSFNGWADPATSL
jgi:hypothetical protein